MIFSQTLRVIGVVCSAWLGGLVILPALESKAIDLGSMIETSHAMTYSREPFSINALCNITKPLVSGDAHKVTPCWVRSRTALAYSVFRKLKTARIANPSRNGSLAVTIEACRWSVAIEHSGSDASFGSPALPNDEAQTPRLGCPNSMVFSDLTARYRGCL